MQASNLKFSIEVSKDKFSPGEAIPCKLILTNTGSNPVYVNQRMLVNFPDSQHDVYFEILDDRGNKVPFSMLVNAGLPKDSDFKELSPGKSVEKKFDLQSGYISSSGNYQVKAVYENKSNANGLSNVWKGKTESNTLTIRVG